MRRSLHIVSILVFCVLGSGAEWDTLQVLAWGRMIAGHSRTMSLPAAVKKTFDGETCNLCRMVEEAKKQEPCRSTASETKMIGKVLLFFQADAAPVFGISRSDFARPENSVFTAAILFAPPVPPPRQAFA